MEPNKDTLVVVDWDNDCMFCSSGGQEYSSSVEGKYNFHTDSLVGFLFSIWQFVLCYDHNYPDTHVKNVEVLGV